MVVLFVVGIVSGRSTSPLPSSAPSTSAPAHQGVAAIPTTAPQSAAPVIPPPSAASAPPRATVTTLGSGGTGWQVQTFRYGAHAGFYRIVIDLAPAAGGAPGPSPTVTVAEQDASTVLVTLQGTQPAASTGTLTNTATISAVTLVPAAGPGETQYRITLTHAGTVHAFFTTTPLRLILDIT